MPMETTKSERHTLQIALENLREVDLENDMSELKMGYNVGKFDEALMKLQQIDHEDVHSARETLDHVRHDVLAPQMSDDDVEYVEGEILEAVVLIDGVLKEWEESM